jgi:hypothetical protein
VKLLTDEEGRKEERRKKEKSQKNGTRTPQENGKGRATPLRFELLMNEPNRGAQREKGWCYFPRSRSPIS